MLGQRVEKFVKKKEFSVPKPFSSLKFCELRTEKTREMERTQVLFLKIEITFSHHRIENIGARFQWPMIKT